MGKYVQIDSESLNRLLRYKTRIKKLLAYIDMLERESMEKEERIRHVRRQNLELNEEIGQWADLKNQLLEKVSELTAELNQHREVYKAADGKTRNQVKKEEMYKMQLSRNKNLVQENRRLKLQVDQLLSRIYADNSSSAAGNEGRQEAVGRRQ